MVEVQTEKVLVVPTEVFHRIGHFQGFSTEIDRYLDELLSGKHISYRSRGEMENDPSFKQLIPYVVFRHQSPDGTVSLFQYTRGKGQGEGRLHSKRSIGIGGHISSADAETDGSIDPYDEGMRRELAEEVSIDTPYSASCIGLINDDETEVGRVHLGVVHVMDVDAPCVSARESDIANSGFQPFAQLLDEIEQFETWSQICLKALGGGA